MRTESLTRIFLTFFFLLLIYSLILIFPLIVPRQDKRDCRRITILNSLIGFPSGRRTLFLNRPTADNSSFFIQMGSSTSEKLRLCRKERWLCREYSYGILSVHLCWTLGTRQLDFWYQTAGLFWYYYSKVFTVAFLPNVSVVCREYSHEILSVHLCCTVGIPMLHLWCQGAALLVALLFVSLYSGFSVGQIF